MSDKLALNPAIVERLVEFCREAGDIDSDAGLDRWSIMVGSFLRTALGEEEAREFHGLQEFNEWHQNALRVGHLQGLIARSQADRMTVEVSSGLQKPRMPLSSRKVFVVHGHDNEAKEVTARFLEKLGLCPIILHEQPNSGRTLIEKFETYSDDVAFAVVLLTPDDVGRSQLAAANLLPRARQNVVLELGYFMGRLGRARVCALHKQGIELPSDYQGVVYIEMDTAGAWKPKVAQELIEAKISIDLSGVVSG